MNKPLKYLLLFGLLANANLLFSQEKQSEEILSNPENTTNPYKQKIDRQIEMAEMILDQLAVELYQKKSSVFMVYHKNAQGFYVENKGVVIKLTPLPLYQTLRILSNNAVKLPPEHSRALYGEGYVGQTDASQNSKDSSQYENQALAKELMEVFYLKYGSIFRDLRGDEKLILSFEGSKTSTALQKNIRFYSLGQNSDNAYSFTSSLTKADIDAYENGQIKKEDLLGRIEYTETHRDQESAEDNLEFNVFARILRRLIADDMKKENWTIGLQQTDRRFEDLGYVLEYTFSEYKKLKNSEAIQLDFIESTKEHILNYGPTLKSLKSDESLLIILKNRSSKNRIEITFKVKKQVLEEYDRQEISLENAKDQIQVEINLEKP